MMGGSKLPPIPYLLSNMVTQKNVRKPDQEEAQIMRDDELAALEAPARREEVCFDSPSLSRPAATPVKELKARPAIFVSALVLNISTFVTVQFFS